MYYQSNTAAARIYRFFSIYFSSFIFSISCPISSTSIPHYYHIVLNSLLLWVYPFIFSTIFSLFLH